MSMREYVTPDTRGVDRTTATGANGVYVRAYLLLRRVIGWLGLLLPVVMILVGGFFLKGLFDVRGSLSAYYHSSMRDVFVGTLVAIGVFLITYKVFERGLDNTLSIVAGLAAIVVAGFPTYLPGDADGGLTPLQDSLGEDAVAGIHFGGAFVFIVSLAVISLLYGVREGRRTPGPGQRRTPAFWRAFHYGCAGAIAVALVYIGVSNLLGWLPDDNSLLIGESLAVLAFGLSWLFKGEERDLLRRLRREAAGLSAVRAG